MRRINKTIYITSDDLYLHCDHGSLALMKEKSIVARIPVTAIEQIVIFGNATISSYLIRFCNENHILMTYVSEYGNLYGNIIGTWYGNVDLRDKQYRLQDSGRDIVFVRNILLGKMNNSRNVIMRCAKDASDENADALYLVADRLKNHISKLPEKIEDLRIAEANAASEYFSVFDNMLKHDDESMSFRKRTRRPPENNCNAIMSLLYTLFTGDCVAALAGNGLDVYKGYLHTVRAGRKSLACDLVEEFRACIVDKFIITMINRRQLTGNDFQKDAAGIKLKHASLQRVLQEWEKYKAKEIVHPLYRKKYEQKVLPYLQAQLMAQYIRGDIPEYPPFIWKQ